MSNPHTPRKSGLELLQLIDNLNEQFGLDLPNPKMMSPSWGGHDRDAPRWHAYRGLKRLYFSRKVDINCVLNDFDEYVLGQGQQGVSSVSTVCALDAHRSNHALKASLLKDERLGYLTTLINDWLYLLDNGSFSNVNVNVNSNSNSNSRHSGPPPAVASRAPSLDPPPASPPLPPAPPPSLSPTKKRRFSVEEPDPEEEYHTAPNSPGKNADSAQLAISALDNDDMVDPETEMEMEMEMDGRPVHNSKNPRVAEILPPRRTKKGLFDRFLNKDTGNINYPRHDAVAAVQQEHSFSTTTTTTDNTRSGIFDTSFASTGTQLTEPIASTEESQYGSSVVDHMVQVSMDMDERTEESIFAKLKGEPLPVEERSLVKEEEQSFGGNLMHSLLHYGPFSLEQPLKETVPLRYRYELERIGRAWNVPLDRMLVGDTISFKTYDEFWKWIASHSQRAGKPLPEKPSTSKAWDSAVGDFKTGNHSEVVVMSGDMSWCEASEPGILKLRLHPLKTERTCRFHRRFGSDRFLSLTVPAPARPPRYLQYPAQPQLLRETLALWLTNNEHRCLGRKWRPFYVEEVKSKKSSNKEPRFRVEFFTIDGVDFSRCIRPPPEIAPPGQDSERHTAMSLEALINWHMPWQANIKQSNCKLFQRLSLGLSKTFATVSVLPRQVLYLRDAPGETVMNDGCALMSRALANQICDSLGITSNTPSCFQGRIAGAKGLWMVDKHESRVSAECGDDAWIQISDSQLKIKPHPQEWREPVDEEKLTFEVVKYSKPLHPVELNIQLLGILEHGGHIRDYVAELTRAGIQGVYQDFAKVLQSNSPLLCRDLVQKVKPTSDDSAALLSWKVRHLEAWPSNNAEAIIRLTEAGFAPRSFYPLRRRLNVLLREVLSRYMEDLHIRVPLSTYAFCIADPYGVLKEDEVHFGFSGIWKDEKGNFEENLLDGRDVLVGRLPAHLPSDIQRRRAVWKTELRVFKDVIVFPSVGKFPLAHLLSGGDYDGDTPWICWDEKIVNCFTNSALPTEEYPPEHFGLTEHAVPMEHIQSIDEFLQSAFTFNLTLSNLGRCTVEHEKIAYDESIDSPNAKELACLLSHLVDGRKGGVHLSEQAWQKYRKKISPRARDPPAYKNPRSTRYKSQNIIDDLLFNVAKNECDAVFRRMEQEFPENEMSNVRDEDLCAPWREVLRRMDVEKDSELRAVRQGLEQKINHYSGEWVRAFNNSDRAETSFPPAARQAIEAIVKICPPQGTHPLIQTWQNCPDAWLQVLASSTYEKRPSSTFVMHAFGEILCRIKSSTVPSRTITNEMAACYRVNQKAVARLAAQAGVGSDGDEDEYEGQEAIEAMMSQGEPVREDYEFDDGMSVE